MASITQRFPFSSMLAQPRQRTVLPRLSSTQVLLSRPPGYIFRGPLPTLSRRSSASVPGVTNYALNSDDLTAWTGTGLNTATAGTVTDTDGATISSRSMSSPIANDSRTYLWSGLIAKNAGNIVGLRVELVGGATPLAYILGIDTVAGQWSPADANSVQAPVTITDAGSEWLVTVALVNNGTGNTALKTTFYPAYSGFPLVLPNQTAQASATGSGGLRRVMIEALGSSPFKIECEGDSVTAGSTYPPYSNGLGLVPNVSVFNTGVSGSSTTQMRSRFDGYKFNGYTHFILLGGVNDIASGATLASIQANLSYMWSSAQALGMTVVALPVTPWKGSASWSSAYQTVTETLNAWIAQQAQANGYLFIDFYSLLQDPANPGQLLPALDATDHIHPNAVGRQLMAKALRAALSLPVPCSPFVGPTTSASVTGPAFSKASRSPISSTVRMNKFLGSVLGGGGSLPTQWTLATGGGTSVPQTSILGSADGASAYKLTTSAARQYWYQVVALSTVNQLYAFSLFIEAVTGTIAAQEVMVPVSLPAGAVLTFPVCPANPSGGSGGTLQPGVLLATVQLGSTTGNATVRLGLGCSSNQTGSVTFSRPQSEHGGSRGTFVPTTTAPVTTQDFTAAGGILTLTQALGASEVVEAELPTMLDSLLS